MPFARGLAIEQELESDSANFTLRCQAARKYLEAASIHGGPEAVDSLTERAKVVRGRPQVGLAARAWRGASWILDRSPDHAGVHRAATENLIDITLLIML